jgi:hypothetical protein
MNTHGIVSIKGRTGWWYTVFYDGGRPEENAFRMDHYPCKDRMAISIHPQGERRFGEIYRVFREEVERRKVSGGKAVIPEVVIRGRKD